MIQQTKDTRELEQAFINITKYIFQDQETPIVVSIGFIGGKIIEHDVQSFPGLSYLINSFGHLPSECPFWLRDVNTSRSNHCALSAI